MGGPMTEKLDQFMSECPAYSYNAKTGMFEATVYGINEDGRRSVITRYSITPNVFLESMRRRQEAIDQMVAAREKCGKVIQMKGGG